MPILTCLVGFAVLQSGWEALSIESKFRVDVPEPAVRESPAEYGLHPQVKLWVSDYKDQYPVLISYRSVGKGDGRVNAGHAHLTGMMRSLSGPGRVLTTQRDFLLDGWRGVEFEVKEPTGDYHFAWCVAADDATLMIDFPGKSRNAVKVAAKKMFASVRLEDGVLKGPFKIAEPTFKPFLVPNTPFSVGFPMPPRVDHKLAPEEKKGRNHSYFSRHINRRYWLTTSEISKDVGDPKTFGEGLMKVVHAQIVRNGKSRRVQTSSTKVAGVEGKRTTCITGDGGYFIRCESVTKGNRMYTLIAEVPLCLRQSPEIDRFFASAKFK